MVIINQTIIFLIIFFEGLDLLLINLNLIVNFGMFGLIFLRLLFHQIV